MNFSHWSNFHVSIITGSAVMTIFFSRGLARNPEVGNTPSEFCLISGDWIPNYKYQVTDTKFGTNISNEMLLNAAKCQNSSLSFTISELLREN